jgi:DNA uptake protein ComE-like DNA-binding protein
MKGIYAFLAGLASAFGLAWLYNNNPEFRQSVDSARDKFRNQTESAAENISNAAQSASENAKRRTSAAADAARRAVFTRASSRSKSNDQTSAASTSTSGIDLNECSREELVRAGLTDDLADKILENRPYRNKLDLVSRLVIPESDYERIKHSISVKESAATDSINVAS